MRAPTSTIRSWVRAVSAISFSASGRAPVDEQLLGRGRPSRSRSGWRGPAGPRPSSARCRAAGPGRWRARARTARSRAGSPRAPPGGPAARSRAMNRKCARCWRTWRSRVSTELSTMPLKVGRRRAGGRRAASRAATRTTRRPAPGRGPRSSRSAGRRRSARCRPPWRPGAATRDAGCCPRTARSAASRIARRVRSLRSTRLSGSPAVGHVTIVSVHMCPRSRAKRLTVTRRGQPSFECTDVHSTFDLPEGGIRWVSPPPSSAREAVAALASPQGVDRYLEQVNPMWAAHEVRARIVDVHREVDVPGHPPVATITLQPTSTWQGHRAGQHVQLGVEIDGARRTTRVFTISSPDSRHGDRFTVTLRANPDGVVSRYLVERATPGTMVHLSQAQGEFVLPDQVPEHVRVHLRRLRHHPGDVDAALAAAPHPPRPGHLRALRAEPRAPDLRRRARRDPSLGPRHRPAPAAPRARRPEPVAGVPRAAGARLPRRARPGPAARRR